MPEATLTYLEALDHVGVVPSHYVDPETGLNVPNPRAGEPDALNSIGINIPMPIMVGDDVVMTTRRAPIHVLDSLGPDGALVDDQHRFCRARILPGTRIVETDHAAVVNLLMETGHYRQVDPPKSVQPRKPKTNDTPSKGKEG